MPSTRIPTSTVNPTTGLPITSGGSSANTALAVHIADPTAAHAASAISTTSLPPWLNGELNPASDAQTALAKIVSDLVTPDVGTFGIYTESPGQWHDGANIGSAGPLFDMLVDLCQDLSGNNATLKTGGSLISASVEYGYGSGSIPAGSLRSQLVALMAASNHVFSGGAAWADGTTNGQNGLQTFLNNLLTSLSGTAGAAKIGAAATNGFTAGSIRTQLNEIAPATSGTAYTAAKTFNGATGDTNPVFITTSVPTTRKLLWEINSGSYQIRFYSTPSALFEITTNAAWDGTQWNRDASNTPGASKYVFGGVTSPEAADLVIFHKSNTASWLDSAWNDPPLRLSGNLSASSTGVSNVITPRSICKAWGKAQFATGSNGNPSSTADEGFNITSMTTASNDVVLTFADDFTDTDYIVIATCDNFDVGPVLTGKAVGSCRLQLWDRASGAAVDAETATFQLHFVAYGNN